MEAPETRYAHSGDLNIAYQVLGEGEFDLVIVPGFASNVDMQWIDPDWARGLRRLASFSRLICFDKRGTGLSDPTGAVPTLEERMDDVRAVMDAAGSKRAALLGYSEGGPMSVLFAATYPERVRALVLLGTFATGKVRPHETPWAPKFIASRDRFGRAVEEWGQGHVLEIMAPSTRQNQLGRRLTGMFERACASPAMAHALWEAVGLIDVRSVLPMVTAPTLVLHRTDEFLPIEAARDMASQIPGARFTELPGEDHLWWVGDADGIIDEIEEFLTGARHVHEGDRALATVLFTDIVASTEKASQLGDRAWRELLERHDAIVRREVAAARGRIVKSLGDGYLATFAGPARAIDAARSIAGGSRSLGVDIRAGVHTGECELFDDDIGGLAVHIGARVSAAARPGEILVSGTVKDLVVGSGLTFADRGTRELRGVPGEWHLYAVADRNVPAPALPSDIPPLSSRAMLAMARRSPKIAQRMVRLARGRGEHPVSAGV